MIHLESEDPDKDINIYINSPGGSVYAGLAIYDTMQFIKPDVATTCVGIAMSMGALLLAAGTEGKRTALPNSKILIHQVSGGFQGQGTDIEIQARETINLKRRLEEIIAQHTNQPIDKVSKDMERDYYMTADEAQRVRDRRQVDRPPVDETAGSEVQGETVARASEGNEQLLCSFCGKSQRQVKKLIAGPGVYICDECIDLCNEIIDEELTTPTQLDLDNLPRPRDIYAVLNDYVVSQEEAKRTLVGRGLQPLQARPDGRRTTTRSSSRSRTSCCSARPAAARRCSRRRSRGSSTSRSRSPTRRR